MMSYQMLQISPSHRLLEMLRLPWLLLLACGETRGTWGAEPPFGEAAQWAAKQVPEVRSLGTTYEEAMLWYGVVQTMGQAFLSMRIDKINSSISKKNYFLRRYLGFPWVFQIFVLLRFAMGHQLAVRLGVWLCHAAFKPPKMEKHRKTWKQYQWKETQHNLDDLLEISGSLGNA